MDTQTNGEGVQAKPVDTIILTYDPVKDRLDIKATCTTMDKCLDMLLRAYRHYKAEFRAVRAAEIMARKVEEAQNRQLAANIMGGKRIS